MTQCHYPLVMQATEPIHVPAEGRWPLVFTGGISGSFTLSPSVPSGTRIRSYLLVFSMVRCGVNFQSHGWSDLLKTQSVKAHDTPLVKTPQCPSILLRVRTEVVVGAPSSLYQVSMNSDEKVHPWDTCSASACAFASVLCAVPRTLSWVFSVAPTLTSC